MPSFLIRLLPVLAFTLSAMYAQDRAALTARLLETQAINSIDDPALQPWHLKLAVQLFNAKGEPTDQGTIEEWWAAPDQRKIAYAFPSYQATQLQNPTGSFRSKQASYAPPSLDALLEQVVHPMPSQAVINQATPDLRKQNFGKLALECIMLTQPLPGQAYPPLGLFPTYCLTPGTQVLRLSFNYGSQFILRNTTGTFQGRTLALDVAILSASIKTASAHVTSLASIPNFDSAFFNATEDLEPFSSHIVRVGAGVMAGGKIGGDPPRYPELAKEKHISGRVLLRAVVTRDGHIASIIPVTSDDPLLTQAAITAVRTWIYKPYLLNGEPTEVDTTITVNFAFSH